MFSKKQNKYTKMVVKVYLLNYKQLKFDEEEQSKTTSDKEKPISYIFSSPLKKLK